MRCQRKRLQLKLETIVRLVAKINCGIRWTKKSNMQSYVLKNIGGEFVIAIRLFHFGVPAKCLL